MVNTADGAQHVCFEDLSKETFSWTSKMKTVVKYCAYWKVSWNEARINKESSPKDASTNTRKTITCQQTWHKGTEDHQRKPKWPQKGEAHLQGEPSAWRSISILRTPTPSNSCGELFPWTSTIWTSQSFPEYIYIYIPPERSAAEVAACECLRCKNATLRRAFRANDDAQLWGHILSYSWILANGKGLYKALRPAERAWKCFMQTSR